MKAALTLKGTAPHKDTAPHKGRRSICRGETEISALCLPRPTSCLQLNMTKHELQEDWLPKAYE